VSCESSTIRDRKHAERAIHHATVASVVEIIIALAVLLVLILRGSLSVRYVMTLGTLGKGHLMNALKFVVKEGIMACCNVMMGTLEAEMDVPASALLNLIGIAQEAQTILVMLALTLRQSSNAWKLQKPTILYLNFHDQSNSQVGVFSNQIQYPSLWTKV